MAVLRPRPPRLLAPLVLVLLGCPAFAAEFTVGLGAGAAPDYEGSDDYRPVPAWLILVDDLYHPDTYVRLSGPELRSNFIPHPHLRAGVSGTYIRERDDVEDDAVDEMSSVDAGLFLGGVLGWDFLPSADVELAVLVDLRYDVANDNGYLVTPRLSYSNRLYNSPVTVGVELFGNYASEDYMSEYFGVSADDAARSGLDAFDADAGFKDLGVGATVTYRFFEHWSASLLGGYARLLGDAADSPVVDARGDDNQMFLGATLNYRL